MRVVGVAILIYFGFSAMGDVKYIATEYGDTTSNDIAATAGRLTVNLILTFIGAVLAMNTWGKSAKEEETGSETPSQDAETPDVEGSVEAEIVASSPDPHSRTK